jgi:hypothetical protein
VKHLDFGHQVPDLVPLACCGCIKPDCDALCDQERTCETEASQIASRQIVCGSLAVQEACGCKKCFDTAQELRDVVDQFMLGGSAEMAQLSTTHGLPIGTWCVSQAQDFSDLFSAARNANASFFNEDISTWCVSSATDMRNISFMLQEGSFSVVRVQGHHDGINVKRHIFL